MTKDRKGKGRWCGQGWAWAGNGMWTVSQAGLQPPTARARPVEGMWVDLAGVPRWKAPDSLPGLVC